MGHSDHSQTSIGDMEETRRTLADARAELDDVIARVEDPCMRVDLIERLIWIGIDLAENTELQILMGQPNEEPVWIPASADRFVRQQALMGQVIEDPLYGSCDADSLLFRFWGTLLQYDPSLAGRYEISTAKLHG